jgi:hypothetical protein
MANWALIENGEITEKHDLLPENWRNVSGLRKASDDIPFLNSLGWYPVTKKHQIYDNNAYKETGVNHAFENGQVIETLLLEEKPPLWDQFSTNKYNFIFSLRQERDKKLSECDWTQLNDVSMNMSPVERNKWGIYRQMLRDLPQLYADNDVIELDRVNWPDFDSILVDETGLLVNG